MVKKILGNAYIGALLALLYAPLLVLFLFSFSSTTVLGDWNSFFENISFQPYIDLFTDTDILTALGNTLLIGGVASLFATLLGTLAAIGLNNMKKRPAALISGVSQIPILNADIITGFSLMIFFLAVHISNGYVSLILAHLVICTPYVVLSVMPRLSQLNPNLYEAALDLGATPGQATRKVLIPQLIPGMISGFILSFTLSIDDFVISFFNKGTDIDTISTYIYGQYTGKNGLSPAIRALSLVIFVVIFALLLLINLRAQRNANANKAAALKTGLKTVK